MNENISNGLTLFRMAATPVIALLLYFPGDITWFLAVILFALASFSDFLDGRIARRYNIISEFGRCFDSIADKILVLTTLMMLVYLDKAAVLACVIIMCREILVAGVREYLSTSSQRTLPSSRLGKYKATFQMIALLLLITFDRADFVLLGNISLWFSAFLALASAYGYMRVAFWPQPEPIQQV